MTQRLEGRTAVVTGAARGIGFGIASRFVKEGCAVALTGVDAHPFEADYNAAKEAVRAITRSAAREWAQKGVLVNAIAPFAASSAFLRVQQSRPDAAAKLVSQVPVGRMGDPEGDIAP